MDRVTANTPLPSGLDLQWIDESVAIGDDLFTHVNGRWLAEHQIPADRSIDGAFHVLRDNAEAHVREIVEEAARTPGEPIGDLYTSFMDTDRIAALGAEPIADDLAAIEALSDTTGFAALLGRLGRGGVPGLFGFYVDTDAKDSDRYLVHLVQSGLGLPDESYYREDKHAATRAAYLDHVEKMFALAGLDEPARAAATVLDLETALAEHHWDVVRRRDAQATYNLHSYDELVAAAAGFDVGAWITAVAGDDAVPGAFAEVNVGQPSFLTAAARLLAERPLDDWKTWLRWRLLRSAAPYLSPEFVDENFAFYGTTLSGAPENRDRWKRGVGLVEDAMGFAVGEKYVEKHFPPAAKARMDELIANLIEAYRRNITDLEWMTPATRERALAKLDRFTPKIGYPATTRDYNALIVDREDLLGNVARAAAYETDRELAKIGQPVDRDEWFMTPQTVNAYYNPGMNEIVFPAAILQPPFFDADADDAANYGGIGAVIGHEIGHGFDDQGAKYDGDGNLVDWWTDDDRTEFGKRTAALAAQYAQYTPTGLSPEHTVNGEFTLGENIGDLGGLSIALVAYAIAGEADGGEPPVIDGLTGPQRVFFSWAQIWRTKTRDEEAIRRLSIDPHSPPEFRCNGVVRNIDAFYEAFDVPGEAALFLAPADRVRIW
ncbi:putative metalloendopeptidase [Gordonia hirsuta DSM 44140 = NBRC 16056]|uniref:Putative metalloendopeptidase n=1 Tax=Gordonia hirsuta DSM 44140 = NBRC 16056 TaxID=1121927 RepID=L7LAI8_9ACTN|nr:M13-type metalloendopeptidase [Gordonia hirsuta]GAC57771.1 putative metalloendopeptidase [Gordonia hirsuta DSM 44140 = NBRC 16056]